MTQYIDYYFKYGRGAENHEAEVEAELARQTRRNQMQKRKQRHQTDVEEYDVFDIEDVVVHQVRLDADGELTDSFIQDVDSEQQQSLR